MIYYLDILNFPNHVICKSVYKVVEYLRNFKNPCQHALLFLLSSKYYEVWLFLWNGGWVKTFSLWHHSAIIPDFEYVITTWLLKAKVLRFSVTSVICRKSLILYTKFHLIHNEDKNKDSQFLIQYCYMLKVLKCIDFVSHKNWCPNIFSLQCNSILLWSLVLECSLWGVVWQKAKEIRLLSFPLHWNVSLICYDNTHT